MAYTKVFTNPHPNGWDNPSERPPITADVLQAHTDAIQAIDNYLAAGGGGGGGGSDYILPVATSTILGGVKVDGDTIAVTADGTISVTAEAGAIKNTSDLTNDGSGSGSYFVEESELAQVAFAGNWSALEGKPTIPTKTSQLTNDSNFLTSIPKASTTTLGGIKLDGETLTMNIDGVVSVTGGAGASYIADLKDVNIALMKDGDFLAYDTESSTWTNQAIDLGAGSRELTLAEYDALSTEEKNNDTSYFITDADNIDPGSVGTAGTLKPWLYNSNEEVVIGVYDGKPLYRKTLQVQTINQTIIQEYSLADYGIDNVCEIKYFDGFIKNDSSGSLVMLNYYLDNNDFCCSWLSIGNVFKIYHTPSLGFAIINFEYTKTTDAENSGVNLMPYSFVQNGGGGFKEPVYLYEGNLTVSGIEGTNITFDYNLSDYNWLYIGNNLADYPNQIYSHMIPISVLKMLNGKIYQSGHFSNESFIGVTWVSENELKFVSLGQYYTTTLFYIIAM